VIGLNKDIQGAKFTIKVFISVALVAVIRKILVTSLKTDAVEAQLSLLVAVAVLGGVYWLVSKGRSSPATPRLQPHTSTTLPLPYVDEVGHNIEYLRYLSLALRQMDWYPLCLFHIIIVIRQS
jgi:hypothetical protein